MSKRPRKLINQELLYTLYDKHEEGIPVTRLIRDYNLDVSSQHLKALFKWYSFLCTSKGSVKDVLSASLFPPWLTMSNKIQEQPTDKYKYKGFFPYGKWEQIVQ